MKKTLYLLLVFAVAAAGYWFVAPRQLVVSDAAKGLDGFAAALIDEQAIPGLAIAVVKDQKIVHMQGYGFADLRSHTPMTPDTPMNIASISKPILGIVLLQLRDEGRLDVDADINGLLPFRVEHPNSGGGPITIRQLATHTSGIADYYDTADYQPGADSPRPLNDYLRSLLSPEGARYDGGAHYLDAKPGTVREYSNLGAGVAGAVAERAGGAPLAALAKDNIFAPLGMANSSWLLADYPAGKLATRYEVYQCLPYTSLCASTGEPKRNYLIGKIFRPASTDRHIPSSKHGSPHQSLSAIRQPQLSRWRGQRIGARFDAAGAKPVGAGRYQRRPIAIACFLRGNAEAAASVQHRRSAKVFLAGSRRNDRSCRIGRRGLHQLLF